MPVASTAGEAVGSTVAAVGSMAEVVATAEAVIDSI
jgi:hypothetical protein